MDILEFAMKMELDGKAFYDKHARRTSDNDLKRIFKLLSEEEERHYQFFKKSKVTQRRLIVSLRDQIYSKIATVQYQFACIIDIQIFYI